MVDLTSPTGPAATEGSTVHDLVEGVARFQRARTGLPESYFHVIENGIDTSRFERLPASERTPEVPLRVVSVSR